jgi:hypothetical protein
VGPLVVAALATTVLLGWNLDMPTLRLAELTSDPGRDYQPSGTSRYPSRETEKTEP